MSKKQINYEEEYFRIKSEVMDEMGYDEEDMLDGSIEELVNRETDQRFYETYEFDINDWYQ